uniref:non-specific serine/threonine protein kinase n=1 Tax=Glossina morsitans morsitans TaxID=37546 RepID=A0A1B0FB29_GLOMM
MYRYTVNSLIGEGSFGRVYKATRKDDDQTVAIKVISKRGRSSRELKNLRRECDIQAQLKHPNVIEMLESFETKNELVVVTEFAVIDLHRYMSRHGALNEEQAQRLICHLVSALYYLHSNRILHRDLKPQNVLLDEDLNAKLCDFGLARNMTMGTHVLTSIKGTPLYMAPELLAERPYDHQADLWSLGCISYEAIAGQPPFCTTSILHLVKMIKHEEVKWPSFLTSDCRSFLQGLLEKDPSLRTSWTQILCHPFVDGKLYIKAGVKAENSPFINPQGNKYKMKVTAAAKETLDLKQITKNLQIIKLDQMEDNLSTSRDSINAIPASDLDPLETDIEENLNRVVVPFIEQSIKENNEASNDFNIKVLELATQPAVNSQTCFVSGNNNMILNHLNDNFNVTLTANTNTKIINPLPKPKLPKSRNKDLEKRKLSQNLDNFSLRLGQSHETEQQQQARRISEKNYKKEGDKDAKDNKVGQLRCSMLSLEEKRNVENSPPCLLPGWDSCDESESPPIENDEWLAFLHRSIQEVLDGELESLKQQNLVSIIVAPLRNSKAIPKVMDSVAQLLALPFVLNEPVSILEVIKTVYVDVKLVPNLMYASKLLIYQRNINDSTASLPPAQSTASQRQLRALSELNNEEIKCTSRLYELICHLVHLRLQFLSQFCDAVAILAADDLMITFINQDFKNSFGLRIANCVLALLGCVLRQLPENAELVENIVLSDKVNLLDLLSNKNDLMRLRMCMLIRLLGRFSLRALQKVWSSDLKRAIETLAEDDNSEVKQEAENTLAELCQFSFYT